MTIDEIIKENENNKILSKYIIKYSPKDVLEDLNKLCPKQPDIFLQEIADYNSEFFIPTYKVLEKYLIKYEGYKKIKE